MSRRRAYPLLALACSVPRLAVLLHERGRILSAFTEKSWDFALTFVSSGTFGFIPGVPSASTQPLYGFFLVPIAWIFGASWLWVGLTQIALAVCTCLLVYEVGRRIASPRVGVAAALLATLQPYLVWHDVHLNREILDQLLGAALVLVALIAWERRSVAWAAALGAVGGLAILSNTRLVLVPLLLTAYLLRARVRPLAAVALLAASVLVVTPWVIRNRVQIGCFTITTDAKALWKANNVNTYSTLARGGWIDDVPNPPGVSPNTPEIAGAMWRENHVLVHVNECRQMRTYEHLTWAYWRGHPGGKVRLAVQATKMLWSPAVRKDQTGAMSNGLRTLVEVLWAVPVYLLALAGLFLVRGPFRFLAISLLVYETATAWVFAGTTRYRVPWDFVLALLAATALDRLLVVVRSRRSRYSSSVRSVQRT